MKNTEITLALASICSSLGAIAFFLVGEFSLGMICIGLAITQAVMLHLDD